VHLAEQLGGRAIQFDAWTQEFQNVDIVISSTAAPHYILDRGKLEPIMKLRRNRPLLLIDIAVPRDIEPEINFLENVFLYNIDDLQAIAVDYLKQRQLEVARCEQIIRDKAAAVLGPPVGRPSAVEVRPAFGGR
jgi:glutamyl-tRNA reductase